MFACQLHDSAKTRKMHDFEFEKHCHQFIAKLPQNANKIVKFLKNKENLAFSEKKASFFFKIGKGGKFGRECVLNDTIS